MATRNTKTRDDWQEIEPVRMANGPGMAWRNRVSGESVVLPDGIHPLDSPTTNVAAFPVARAEEDDEPAEETAEDRVRVLLGKVQGEGRALVKLMRFKPDGSKSFCKDYPVDEFESGGYEMIRQQFGAGKYHIILYGTNPETNKFAIRGSERIEIEASLAPNITPSAADPSMQMILQRLEKLDANPPQTNQAMDFRQMLEMMALMKSVFASPPAPSMAEQVQGFAGIIAGMKGLQELANPNAEPPDPMLEIGKQALGVLPALLAARNPPAALPAPAQSARLPAPAQPNPAQPAAPNQAANPPTDGSSMPANLTPEQQQAQREFVQSIQQLNAMAGILSPQTAAGLVYETAPADIDELLAAPDWFEQLRAVVPAIAPNEAWFREVAKEVLQIVADENEAFPDTEPLDAAPVKPATPTAP